MARVMKMVNGISRMVSETSFDETITIVQGTPADGNELQGPVTTGTAITLPNSLSYNNSSNELKIFWNGVHLNSEHDFTYESSTTFSLNFDLFVGDTIQMVVE